MKRKKNSTYFCLEKKLVTSRAWLSLKGIAPQIYMIFRLKCVVEEIESVGKPNKRREWLITNNGKITFTYKQALNRFGITPSRFVRAIDELIAKGFLDIAESGMGVHRQTTKYSISNRWEKYDTVEFVKVERQKAHWHPGFQKKSSIENATETTNENVTEGCILVLRTDRKGKVQKKTYKLRGNKWLQTKIA